MTKIFAVTNHKGGTGKTTIAVNLSACWAQGQRVLLLELDDQGDASTSLGVPGTGELLADALTGRRSMAEAIQTSEFGVDVAAAGEALGYVSGTLGPDAVRKALAPVIGRYDFIVIDCPPGLSSVSQAGWRAAPGTRALIPIDGPAGFRAAMRVQQAWTESKADGALHVVLTRYDRRRVLDCEVALQVRQVFGNSALPMTVRETVAVRESSARRRPLIIDSPLHPVTDDLRRLAREVAHV